MSYCRWGWKGSHVYIYHSISSDLLECCGCSLADGDSPVFRTYNNMLEHINDHRLHGHVVPYEVDNRILEEMRLSDDDPRRAVPNQ